MELNATAKVIVGLLAARPRSGYEIKQLVDMYDAAGADTAPQLKAFLEVLATRLSQTSARIASL